MPRNYTIRQSVNWYSDDSLPPVHGQKHYVTKKYWNQFTGQWCSKKSKREVLEMGAIYYNDFDYYSLKDIERDFGLKWTEQVATFLTKQFFKQFGGFKVDDWTYCYWAYHELEAYLGADWKYRVDKLVDLGVVKVDTGRSRYDSNKSCTYIMLNKRFNKQDLAVLKKVYVKSSRYQSSIKRYYKNAYKERVGILKFIEGALDRTQIAYGNVAELHELIWSNRLKLDRSALDNEYLNVRAKNKISKLLVDIEQYKTDYFNGLKRYNFYINEIMNVEDLDVRRSYYGIQKSKFGGRISHFLSNAPKLYRSSLTIDNEEVIEVDIKASQPSFLYVLFKRWYYSPHKYLADASMTYENAFDLVKGQKFDIYQYMILKLYGLKYVNSDVKRAEVKTLFYRLVFGRTDTKIGASTKRELCAKLFGYDFYDFLVRIAKGRIDWDIDKKYKNLSALLQREESIFMDTVMGDLAQKGIPFIPIYDSLIVKKSDEGIVKDVFEKVILENEANPYTSLANKTAKFRFKGTSAHASASPQNGRSALDGVETMNFMANLMREHIPSDTRMHYIITNGGKAPNVVPDFAEVYYYMRHPRRDILMGLFDRLVNAAEGAALGTGTKMEYEIIGGVYEVLPVDILSRKMHENMSKVGGVTYTLDEVEFGNKIQQSFIGERPSIMDASRIKPYKELSEDNRSGGSTDVADVSWLVPTVGLRSATWIPGTPSHSWQAVACGGTEIGIKGMMVAAKTLTLMGIDLLSDKMIIEKAKAEWKKARGENFKYIPLIGNRTPALNYRD